PYLWLVAFFLVPFLIVLKISLSQPAIAQPPYTPVFDLAAGWEGVREFFASLSLTNYAALAADRLYLSSYLKSLQVAAMSTLILLGLVDEPLAWLSTDTAIYIGIVYSYLPFMVLPIYAVLEKMDDTLLEAAADLGCPPRRAFRLITLPLSLPGVFAGALLCFIPIVGEFVIPDLLGGSETVMIGQTLWTEFFTNRDWPIASAVAVTLLIIL